MPQKTIDEFSVNMSLKPHNGPLDIKLYKYKRFGEYTDQIFLYNTLYFSTPTQLNDPYEFKAPIDHGILSQKVRVRLQELLPMGEITDLERAQIEYFFPTAASPELENKRLAAVNKLREVQATSGIYSLSEKPDSILMWSHYADEHRGLCIEFEDLHRNFLTRQPPLLFKVQYRDQFYDMDSPDVYIFPLLSELRTGLATTNRIFQLLDEITARKAWEAAFSSLAVKATEWEYEKEWRLVTLGVNGNMYFNPFIINSVTFGSKVSDEVIEQYMRFMKFEAGKPSIRFKKASLDELKFRISIHDI